jgi:hypothetical protein
MPTTRKWFEPKQKLKLQLKQDVEQTKSIEREKNIVTC